MTIHYEVNRWKSKRIRGFLSHIVVSALNNTSAPQGKSEAINNTDMCPFQEFENVSLLYDICYELKSLEWDIRTTLVLSNTRELDRKLFYKLVYLI